MLHHVPDPGGGARAKRRACCGRAAALLICDMLPHDREDYRQQMGHVWLGFGDEQMRRLLAGAGFDKVRIATLAADPEAKGPALFVASATQRSW